MRLFKKLLLFLGLPLAVLAGVLWWMATRALAQVTPDNLTLQIESNFNCRAQVGGCQLDLFSSPARLELTGVTLVPRDAEADAGSNPTTRPPYELHATYFKFRSATLEADLWPLLFQRKLAVKRFVMSNADVKFDLLPGGENTLRTLFAKPAVVSGKPNPSSAALAPVVAAVAVATSGKDAPAATEADAKKSDRPMGDEPKSVFNARDLGFSAVTLDRIALEDSRIRARNRKSRSVIELNGCTLAFTDVAVDANALTKDNRATVALDTTLRLDSRKKQEVRYCDLQVTVLGTLAPFDAATGSLNPDLAFQTLIKQGSAVQDLPVMKKLQKNLAKAERAGLRVKDLSGRQELTSDTTLKLKLTDNRLVLLEPTSLVFPDYSLDMEAGSYIDAGTETHEFRATMLASQAVSDDAVQSANDTLANLGDAGAELRKLFVDPFLIDGRVGMAFVSSEDLDDPKVRVKNSVFDLKDSLQDAIKGR